MGTKLVILYLLLPAQAFYAQIASPIHRQSSYFAVPPSSSSMSTTSQNANDNSTALQANSMLEQDPTWLPFESTEKYKRRCLILEDALSNATATARLYSNRATLLASKVEELRRERPMSPSPGSSVSPSAEPNDGDLRADRLNRDAITSLTRRCSFLGEWPRAGECVFSASREPVVRFLFAANACLLSFLTHLPSPSCG